MDHDANLHLYFCFQDYGSVHDALLVILVASFYLLENVPEMGRVDHYPKISPKYGTIQIIPLHTETNDINSTPRPYPVDTLQSSITNMFETVTIWGSRILKWVKAVMGPIIYEAYKFLRTRHFIPTYPQLLPTHLKPQPETEPF